jgi:hypothetical protein
MASDRRTSRTALRGLLVPDVNLVFDSAESTLTQAGARAGLPSPDRRTSTALVATGEQSAAFDVEVVRGGAIGAGLELGATATYTQDGVTYGWDQPTVFRGWEGIFSDSLTHIVQDLKRVGDTLVAVSSEDSGLSVINIWRRTAGTWVNVNSAAYSSLGALPACLIVLPSGRLLCFSISSLGELVQVFSDDTGNTWSDRATLYTLEVNIDGSGATGYSLFHTLSGVYANGQVLLMLGYRIANTTPGSGKSRDGFLQLASVDLGNAFVQVAESNHSVSGSWDCGAGGSLAVAPNGTILFAFASSATNLCSAKICRLATAFSPFTEAEVDLTNDVNAGSASSGGSATEMVDWGVGLVTADNGVVWAYLLDGHTTFPIRSEDDGVTWYSQGTSTNTPNIGSIYKSGNSDSRIHSYAATPWMGGIALAHSWDADSGAYSSKAGGVAYLGGWSTIPMGHDRDADAVDRYSFDRTWIPIDDPVDVGWTKIGAGSVILTASEMNLTTSGSLLSYTKAMTSRRLYVRAALRVASGGVGSKRTFITLKAATGSSYSELEIRIGTTSIVLYDAVAAAVVHTFTIDTTGGVDIIAELSRDDYTVGVALKSVDGPRAYSTDTGLLTETASIDASAISWGHGLASTADSYWTEFHYSEDYLRFYDFDCEHGAPLTPLPTYVASGVSVRAEGGPAWLGDSWALEPRYDFGIERVDPVDSPSPRRGWRSTTDADDVELAWTWGPDHDPGHLMGALVGIGLFNVNFSNFTVQTLDSMGAWNSLTGEVSSSEPDFSSMDVSVKGATVAPSGTATPKPFLKLNELAGSSLYITTGCVRRIKSNSAGRWSTGAGQQARIILESVDGTEPSTSTTASVIPKDFVLVTRLPSTEIRGIRLLIEGQDTAEGFFQIGTAVLGHVEVFADEYGWGRTIDLEPSVERTVLRGGTSRTRVLAPPKRRITFAWEEPVDTTLVEGSEPEPDYLTSSSTTSSPAVASLGSTPSQVYGLVSLLDSGRVPVVYLPSIPLGSVSTDTAILNRRDEMLLSQAVSSVSLETVLGEECSTEMVRIAQVVLEEVT